MKIAGKPQGRQCPTVAKCSAKKVRAFVLLRFGPKSKKKKPGLGERGQTRRLGRKGCRGESLGRKEGVDGNLRSSSWEKEVLLHVSCHGQEHDRNSVAWDVMGLGQSSMSFAYSTSFKIWTTKVSPTSCICFCSSPRTQQSHYMEQKAGTRPPRVPCSYPCPPTFSPAPLPPTYRRLSLPSSMLLSRPGGLHSLGGWAVAHMTAIL